MLSYEEEAHIRVGQIQKKEEEKRRQELLALPELPQLLSEFGKEFELEPTLLENYSLRDLAILRELL